MKQSEMELLFGLSQQFYRQELKKSKMFTLPFAWARNDETGQLLIFSDFGEHSKELAAKLDIPSIKESTK
jgi:hypothetical protein